MHRENISKDHKKRINRVVSFVLKNVNQDHALAKLASIAHYSPFHFQKIFKEVVGESPKQYIIRNRLENACHALIIHRHRSITSLASEYGFSSPAVFARAFKNYFGISADEIRKNSANGIKPHRSNEFLHQHFGKFHLLHSTFDESCWKKNLQISIVRLPAQTIISVDAPMAESVLIRKAFKRVAELSMLHDLLQSENRFIGIINPHQGKYSAGIKVNTNQKLPEDVNVTTIEAGTFATFKIRGNPEKTFHSLHAFQHLWLQESEYRILHLFCFEVLMQDPALNAYDKIERQCFISIERSNL
jgi:AraC family transcriptional regulator